MTAPTIAWLTREDEATLRAYAAAKGEAVERVAGDLIAAELRRRHVPAAPVLDMPKPTRHEQERARLMASIEQVYGGKERAQYALRRFGKG